MTPKNIIVRPANAEDISEVILLLRELGYISEEMSDFRRIWKDITSDPKMGILVAVTDNVISGYLSYSFKPQLRLSGLSMEIDELSVGSKFRGGGIGTELLNHIRKKALELGVKQIIISTNKDRDSYRRGFYTKNGFIEKNSAWLKIDLLK